MKSTKKLKIQKTVFTIAVAALFIIATQVTAMAQQAPPFGGPGGAGPDVFSQLPPGGQGRDMQRPGQEGPGMMPPPPLSEKDIEETLSAVKTDDPDLYGEMLKMKDRDPGAFMRALMEYRMETKMLERLKQENPDEYQNALKGRSLNRKVRSLARKYREAKTDADKNLIIIDLKSTLNELFDLNLAQRKKEIEMLEKRIKDVKEEIEKRKNKKDEIIERHLDEITGVTDDLRW